MVGGAGLKPGLLQTLMLQSMQTWFVEVELCSVVRLSRLESTNSHGLTDSDGVTRKNAQQELCTNVPTQGGQSKVTANNYC